jgi:hypothetical protein
MPWGGLRMVENGLHAVGMKVDPKVAESFTQYRKTHNDACSKSAHRLEADLAAWRAEFGVTQFDLYACTPYAKSSISRLDFTNKNGY